MDELLETIDWLQDLDDSALHSIFAASFSFLQGPIDKKQLSSLSETLEKTPESLERTFEAIGFMITSLSTSRPLPEVPWLPSLQTFLKDQQANIKLAYSLNSLHNPLLSNFKDFDWRLEVQVNSRALEDIITPKIVLQITTEQEQRLLECDYANLKNLYTQLKGALKTFESVRAKKTEKFLKPSKNL